jgi:hypothetical protein
MNDGKRFLDSLGMTGERGMMEGAERASRDRGVWGDSRLERLYGDTRER